MFDTSGDRIWQLTFAIIGPYSGYAISAVRIQRHSARCTCEFEAGQSRRLAIKIFFESDYLKSASEHFRMEQGLQRALGLAIGGSELNSPA